jgi:ubiquinone/menaquinone biosynthesis C-methylase UbiE
LVSKHPAVDEVIRKPPSRVNEEFIKKHNITLMYHAFTDGEDIREMSFDVAKRLGIFRELAFTHDASKLQIVEQCQTWSDVWEKKGAENTDDLKLLNGYEQTDIDAERLVSHINEVLGISPIHSILDVGCGAGYVAQFITNNDYVGIDKSASLVSKMIGCTGKVAVRSDANALPFKDKAFDFVVCIGVFQYFPDKMYAQEVIDEMHRVAKKGIYIGTVRHVTHTARKEKHLYPGPTTHLCFVADDFASFTRTETNYSPGEYFDFYKKL